MSLIERTLGLKRVLVMENERALHLWKGEIRGILQPGEHLLANRRGRLEVECHDLARPEFSSHYEKALLDKLPEVASRHLTVFVTGKSEVAVIERDGRVHTVMQPDQRLVVWTAAGPWSKVTVDVGQSLAVETSLMRRIGRAGLAAKAMSLHPVAEGQAGLLYVDGELASTLKPGVHAFWNVGRMVQVKVIDLRRQSIDIAGQELLTKDRVTIRVNIAAEYRVTDPVKAATAVKDFSETFYRTLQYAFRQTLGAMTLDRILADKASVDGEAAGRIREQMAAIGIEVFEITLKDVILPGEMREILNMVVAAEKEAEANVIRRREETNATRSLLNTAKVMAENPVMLRLKELEALETIAGKVERLTVHNGTAGLLNDLVDLRRE
ncbi:MAG: hypothetical protein CL534_11160 [Ahrensia sp.]|nr:hypothetical protein [Ahrensia sp.]